MINKVIIFYSYFFKDSIVMSSSDWSLIHLLSSAIDQCQSIELMPLTSNEDYIVYCHCEENLYLCLNMCEIRSIVNLCYSYLFSSTEPSITELKKITQVLLCYVTECSTSWNVRRRLVSRKEIDILDELNFSAKLLRLKPKSEQIFRYRRWLIKQTDKNFISTEKELSLCDQASEKHFINYTSWQYRRWLVEYFQLNIEEELNRNRQWLEMNVSDSSGYSFRSYLLSKVPGEKHFIEQELQMNEEKLKYYRDRESLWIYRQTLIFLAWKLFHFDQDELFKHELSLIRTFPQNLFSDRYHRLIHQLSLTHGEIYRNENK